MIAIFVLFRSFGWKSTHLVTLLVKLAEGLVTEPVCLLALYTAIKDGTTASAFLGCSSPTFIAFAFFHNNK